MAASVKTRTRPNAAHSSDMVARWRLRCETLEEQLEDATAALRASEEQRRELAADYRRALNALWKANAGMARRER